MVTFARETLHQFFREHPEALDRAFQAVGRTDFPKTADAWVLSNDATEAKPLERRVDTAMRVKSTDGGEYVVVVEAQGKKDPAKRRSWPYHLTYLHERHQCPVLLVVICQDRATAKWAREPITVGVGEFTSFAVFPFVLEPGNVPVLSEIDESDLILGALSVVIHAREIGGAELRKLAAALRSVDEETRGDLTFYVQLGLGSWPAAHEWSTIMSVDLDMFRKSPILGGMLKENEQMVEARGKVEGKAEGKAEGQAEYLLGVLEWREVELSEEQRERISTCTDLDQLDAWFAAARGATCAADLFG